MFDRLPRLLRPCLLAVALPAAMGTAAGLAVGSSGSAVAAAPAKAVTVDELLTGFAQMPGLYAEFRQESHFGLLAEPLVDTGTLHFTDGTLIRRTQAPSRSLVIMDGKGIEFDDGQRRERIDLAGKPAVRQFVDAFTKIFAGDRAGLETLYRFEFTAGEDRSWTLTLVPKVAPMRDVIAKVVVVGRELDIASLRVLERSGDETVTTFAKVDSQRRYTAAEKQKLLRLD